MVESREERFEIERFEIRERFERFERFEDSIRRDNDTTTLSGKPSEDSKVRRLMLVPAPAPAAVWMGELAGESRRSRPRARRGPRRR